MKKTIFIFFLIIGSFIFFNNVLAADCEAPFCKDLDPPYSMPMMLLDYSATSTLIIQDVAQSAAWVGDESNVEYRAAQSFTLTEAAIITGVSTFLETRVGTPSGDISVYIETDNAGSPSGSLANGAAVSSFTPVDESWNDSFFAPAFELAAGTYWIVYYCDNQTTNEYWILGRSNTSEYAGGEAKYNANGGAWQITGYDMTFKLYGFIEEEEQGAVSTSTIVDFTSYCITQNEYNGSNLTTSTIRCYKPILVQVFYLIDFGFFILMSVIIIFLIKKLFYL